MRLVGDSRNYIGRVEFYQEGKWGTICEKRWDMLDGTVVCRQLGFAAAKHVFTGAHFGGGNGTIWLTKLGCYVMKVRCWIVEMQGWTWENQIALINRTLVWSVTKRLLVSFPQIHYMYKGLWDGAYGLSSLSEKTRKSNRLRMLSQREHSLLSYLKTLSVGPAGVWTYGLPLSRPALIPLS